MDPKAKPKKTKGFSVRVSEEKRTRYRHAIDSLGLESATFIESCMDAIIQIAETGADLALPPRLLTVDQKRALARRPKNPKREKP